MCGIAGLCNFDGRPVDEAVLRRMSELIEHRGPDDDGIFTTAGAPAVGLASRRLAIIDIAGGHQPMSVDDGDLTIVYNGELFNTQELRTELISRGRKFSNHSDTEVILHGYAEWGTDVLDRLNGMWAFALWDRPRQRLFISRDRLGVKPLVYAQSRNGIAFASEMKSLTGSGAVDCRLDLAALPHYLSFFAIPEPLTLMQGVRRLPAGHALLVDADGVREWQYWDCALREEDDRGADAYREEIGELLGDSVRRRLVSDVPLGVLLSGGVDSRLVATLARRDRDELDTFTLGFGTSQADERAAAREVATALGTRHTDAVVDAGEAARAYAELVVAYDEPGQSLVQTGFISALARRDVTVALSGLGGDELYSGYPTHVMVNMLARLDRLPGPLRSGVLAAAAYAPGNRGDTLRKLAAMPTDDRAAHHLMHQTSDVLRRDLLSEQVRSIVDLDGPANHLAQHYERARAQHPLNRLLYVYLKTYLTDELLRATDAMSMRHGLEVRTPFLDYRLVERAMSMPAHHKMGLRRGKLILRAVAQETLSSGVAGKKQGFSPPLRTWLQDHLREQVSELLAPESVRSRGIFDPNTVQRVLHECMAGNDRMVAPVMMLYSFEAWARGWLDQAGAPTADTATRLELRSRQAARDANASAAPQLGAAQDGGTPLLAAPEAAATPANDVADPVPTVSVVIVNWNTLERLRGCLASVAEHLAPIDHEVVVVDNASSDGSPDMVEQDFPQVRLIRNEDNVGFGRANNQAMKAARGRWFLLLNSDTELIDGSVARLVERLDEGHEDIGVAHCRLRFANGRLQQTVYRFPTVGLVLLEGLGLYKFLGPRRAGETLLNGYWDYERERDVDWVAGAFMLTRRACFEQTGGFDERLFMYGEDLDWCFRIHDRGWRIRFYPSAEIIHFDHSSSDLMWGNRPIDLCLETERDVYTWRYGRRRATALVLSRLSGAVMRRGYYWLRARLPGKRASAYAEMQAHTVTQARALTALALGRR